MPATTFDDILKFNPYHDARGRFASANSATSFTYVPGKSKAHDKAIAREKEQHNATSYISDLKLESALFDSHTAAYNSLSKEEQNAIKRYMSTTGISASYKNKDLVDKAIGKAQLPVNATLTRGVRDLPTTMDEAKKKIGETIDTTTPGKPVSTSIKTTQNWGTTTIVIRADKGTKGMYVEVARQSKKAQAARAKAAKEGRISGEAEFLLPSTTKLKITGVRMGSYRGKDKIIYDAIIESQVQKSAPEEETGFSIYKTEDDKRLVFGWASVAITVDGEQLEDRQKDIIDPEDLEEAAYEYVLNFRDTGEEHIKSMRKKGKLVESCVFTKEKQKAMGIPEGTLPVAWWIGFKIEDDDAWARVKNGTYKMFSIEGKANRIPVEKTVESVEKGQLKGCGVLVVQDGKILSGTRIERGGRGQICGPGGHIEAGETPEEAAKREANEEFGITCQELTPLGKLEDGSSAIFVCTKFTGTPKTDEKEMTEPKWRTIEELREENLFGAFEQSLEFLKMSPAKRHSVAKTFDEILKFNPFHDAKGRFASSNSFASYSANPKSKAGAMAISRSAQAGHNDTMNVHRESMGENVGQNYKWLNGGPGAKQLGAQGQLASQKPKQPPKPQKQYDSKGFADSDDAPYHQLYNRKQYFQQQQLTPSQKKAADAYVNPNTEPGSLYNVAQNVNWKMVTGQPLTGHHKQVHDDMMSAMHNIGHNVTLTRYDHNGMVDSLLSGLGAGSDYTKMPISKIQKALVGQTLGENKFISTTVNDFSKAPQSAQQLFTNRAVKINYKAKAGVQGLLMPIGSGGDQGELVLAPTNGKGNKAPKITAVRMTGKTVYRTKTGRSYPQIEIDLEWDD